MSSLLTAEILPSNASNQEVTWTSSNTSVATVNSSGWVTGVAEGNATITVTTDDGGYTATSAITVTAGGGQINALLTPDEGETFAEGEAIQFNFSTDPATQYIYVYWVDGSTWTEIAAISEEPYAFSYTPTATGTLNFQYQFRDANWNDMGDDGEVNVNIGSGGSGEPTAFNLISPSGTANKYTMTYDWEDSQGVDSYTITVSPNSNFSNPVINVSGLTQSTYIGGTLSSNTQYWWKVVAENSYGTTECNSVFNFKTKRKLKSASITSVELSDSKMFNVYPNPASDIITIKTNGFEGKINLVIYSLNGKQMLNKSFDVKNQSSFNVPLNQFIKGTYILMLTNKSGVCYNKSLIIK